MDQLHKVLLNRVNLPPQDKSLGFQPPNLLWNQQLGPKSLYSYKEHQEEDQSMKKADDQLHTQRNGPTHEH